MKLIAFTIHHSVCHLIFQVIECDFGCLWFDFQLWSPMNMCDCFGFQVVAMWYLHNYTNSVNQVKLISQNENILNKFKFEDNQQKHTYTRSHTQTPNKYAY